LKSSKRIMLKTRKFFVGDKLGNHLSKYKGEGYDFTELREYQFGDDIRKIDWNISAKLQKPHVKIFNEERELNVVSVPLLSASTYFGGKVLKQETIAEIVATLGQMATANMDNFSTHIFADREYFYGKPSKKIGAVEKIVDEILNFSPLQKKLNPDLIVETLLQKVKKKSLVFIISDFYTKLDLRYLAKKCEVIAVVIRDEVEENPPPFGFASLVDSESGEVLNGNFSNSKTYIENLQKHDYETFKDFKNWGVRIVKFQNGKNLNEGFRKI
jgi:uncharacterized protein (DUF58 family)